MYHFSRALYRDLRPHLMPDPRRPGAPQRGLLSACEQALERLARDRRVMARPADRLFQDVRSLFPVSRQLTAYELIRARIEEALEYLSAQGDDQSLVTLLTCRATTRRGKACQRQPLPGSRFCPSHRGLAGGEAAAA